MDENSFGIVVMDDQRVQKLVAAWWQWMQSHRKGAPRSEQLAAEQALREVADGSD